MNAQKTWIHAAWRMGLASGMMVWVSACFGDGLQSTIQPESDSARVVQDVYGLVTWITGAIFLLIAGLLFWVVLRYRASAHNRDEIPHQTHGNTTLEIIWTIIPALILIVIAVPTWQGIFRSATPPANALEVEAIGHQWWWEFNYPEQDVRTAGELYLPLGRPVVVRTTSIDVIHSFWVPKLAGKFDSLPGKWNIIWFTPERTGVYYGQCAEFCGTSHANMRFRVRVVSEEEFERWVADTRLPPAPLNTDALAGQQLFTTKICITCHTIRGNPLAQGVLGPNLNNLSMRSAIGSALFENTPDNLAAWIQNPQALKPGTLMGISYKDAHGILRYKPIEMTEAEAQQLAAYLLSPPGDEALAAALRPMLEEAPPAAGGAEADLAAQSPQLDGAAIDAATVDPLVQKGICWACHVIPGIQNATGQIGPSLAGFASRPQIAEVIPMNRENLLRWLEDPQAIKPNTGMPAAAALSAEERVRMVEYLLTLK